MADDVAIFREIMRCLDRGESVVLATIVRTTGSTPRKAGARLLIREEKTVFGTICGGCIEAEIITEGLELFRLAKPRLREYHLNDDVAAAGGLRCGGTMEVYLERISPSPILFLYGAGHISQALLRLAGTLGWTVHVHDDHPGFANAERFPGATIHVAPFGEAASIITEGRHVAAVIATRGHNEDATVFEALHGKALGYFGLVTSKKRVVEFALPLLEKGVPLEKVRAIRAPIGLDIGAESPEEIAVAIVAEILAAFRHADAAPLSTGFWDSPAGRKIPEMAAGRKEKT
jgi:xanthine dehydrogenase accessory factor